MFVWAIASALRTGLLFFHAVVRNSEHAIRQKEKLGKLASPARKSVAPPDGKENIVTASRGENLQIEKNWVGP